MKFREVYCAVGEPHHRGHRDHFLGGERAPCTVLAGVRLLGLRCGSARASLLLHSLPSFSEIREIHFGHALKPLYDSGRRPSDELGAQRGFKAARGVTSSRCQLCPAPCAAALAVVPQAYATGSWVGVDVDQ